MMNEAELDRWQHLEHIAYALDGQPGSETRLLKAALSSFPECSPNDDWPGYVVRHLLQVLVGNRCDDGQALPNDEPQAAVDTDQYFGGCPQCGGDNGYLNVGGNHWFVCNEHKTRWCVGWNLFSSWKDEDEACWAKNAEHLKEYADVKPIYPPEVAISNPVFLYAGRINDGIRDIAEDPFGQHSSGFCRVVQDYADSRCFPVYVKVVLGTDAGDAAKILRDIADRIEANPTWLSPTATIATRAELISELLSD